MPYSSQPQLEINKLLISDFSFPTKQKLGKIGYFYNFEWYINLCFTDLNSFSIFFLHFKLKHPFELHYWLILTNFFSLFSSLLLKYWTEPENTFPYFCPWTALGYMVYKVVEQLLMPRCFKTHLFAYILHLPHFPQPHIADIKWSVSTTVILILSALRVIGFSVSGNLRKISSELQTNFWIRSMNSGRGKEKWKHVRTRLEAFEKFLPCITNAYCVLEFSEGKCLLSGWQDSRKFLLAERRGEKERWLLSASVSWTSVWRHFYLQKQGAGASGVTQYFSMHRFTKSPQPF